MGLAGEPHVGTRPMMMSYLLIRREPGAETNPVGRTGDKDNPLSTSCDVRKESTSSP